jgi:hypothetical protein
VLSWPSTSGNEDNGTEGVDDLRVQIEGMPRRSRSLSSPSTAFRSGKNLQPFSNTMRHILLHPQLRAALPKRVQRDLRSQIWARFKSQVPLPSKRHEPATPEPKELNSTSARVPTPSASKTNLRRGTLFPWHSPIGYMLKKTCRATGTYTGLLWRNWPSHVPRHATGIYHSSVWCCMFNCGTILLQR